MKRLIVNWKLSLLKNNRDFKTLMNADQADKIFKIRPIRVHQRPAKLRAFLLIGMLNFIVLVACNTPASLATQEATAVPDTEPTVTAVEPTVENEPTVAVESTETAVSPTPVTSIDDDETKELLQALLTTGSDDTQEAVERIVAANDPRFISVFLELFRARQVGLINTLTQTEIIAALESLSGETFDRDWGGWIKWYGATDLQPPPGFTTWKGILLSRMDPGFGEFLQDEYPSNIRVEEILWGGVLVDGIPALDYPTMITPEEAEYIDPWDPVFGIAINGEAHAYPLRIIDWHEMANDVVGGVPVSLAYCTLCGAAIAYDGRSVDANDEPITYDFGSSGFLYRSNKLMYDRQTRTLWNQLTGEPVLGSLVDSDIRLELLPVVLTTWEEWQAQHPNTVVVAEDTGFRRNYSPGAAYGNYFAAEETMFPVWLQDDSRALKDQIYALNIDDTPKAYPLDLLTEAGVVNDAVGDTAVTLIANRGIISVDGINQYVGAVTYEAGAEVRAYERGEHTFSASDNPDEVIDESGAVWQVTEEGLVAEDGRILPRSNGHLAYWFGWFAFYPETELFTAGE